MMRPAPTSTLFPYTTLFRSPTSHSVGCGHDVGRGLLGSSELLPQGLVGVFEAENLTRRNVMQFHLMARLVQGALGSNRIQGKSKRPTGVVGSQPGSTGLVIDD